MQPLSSDLNDLVGSETCEIIVCFGTLKLPSCETITWVHFIIAKEGEF